MNQQISNPGRIASIDIFRALTMFSMLLVNDFAGVKGLPHFFYHAKMTEDMMGLSDLVFPAFLFCVGLSIPFAIETRYRKGDTTVQVLGHIFWRTFALVVLGLFSMNIRGVGIFSASFFELLIGVSVFLVWNQYPKTDKGWKKWLFTGLKVLGVAFLAFMFIYKDVNGMPFRVGWWGILGLIGWSYGLIALLYVFMRSNLKKNFIVWVVILVLAVLNHWKGLFPEESSLRVVILPFMVSDWSHHALCMSGVFASVLMMNLGDKEHPGRLVGLLVLIGAIMFGLGILAHPQWIISKNLATPTWLLFCLALFFPLLGLYYFIADTKGWTGWARPIRAAGACTFTCYMLPDIWYPMMDFLGLSYPPALCNGIGGLLRSIVFSLIIILIAEGLSKIHIKLKL